jgi:hypothetical protein
MIFDGLAVSGVHAECDPVEAASTDRGTHLLDL